MKGCDGLHLWKRKKSVLCNAPINVKPAGVGGGGIGRDFDIFQKIAVKFPIPV